MSLIELTIDPRDRDLGGFHVRRLLPYAKRRMVGPFIFLDEMGPADFAPGHGMDVRPHPHIGIATVTYLFTGSIFHRDTLGSALAITPGAVNWMTAGQGIAHSERSEAQARKHAQQMHGLQSWVALPKEYEDCAPDFKHHEAASLPEFTRDGVEVKLIAGRAFGEEAPVNILSPLFYVELRMKAGTRITMPAEYRERALYLVSGALNVSGTPVRARTMPIFAAGETITLEATTDSHAMLLGGDPFSEPRYVWWNFVSSSQDAIEEAKRDWAEGKRFGLVPGDAVERIPLPAE